MMKEMGRQTLAQRLAHLGVCLLLVTFSAAACGGVEDRDTKKSNKGGTGGVGASSNGGATGGDGASSNGGATGGDGDVPVAGAAPLPAPCKAGRMRCEGNTPQTCDEEGNWVPGKACGGTTKVCTGEGVCAAYRLVNAGIDTFGVRPAEPVKGTSIVLKEQTLSRSARTCKADKSICVTGGIR
jgi:hypothetical protein